ncbi:MAG: rod shape-determining protein MreC [Treponema sp.]|jgi:rod shape-determining protein MreC|nr:rod shape-determining protein MreC [Treponema sp.]
MKKGFFGVLSRKSGGKNIPWTPFNSSIYVLISLVVVSIMLLIFSNTSFIFNVKNVGLSFFFGIRGAVFEATSFVSRTVRSVRELADLRKEHSELLRQIERYEELARSSAEIYQENIRLWEQLGFARTLKYRRIPAQISGRDPNNLFSAIVINKGSYSGVSNNMAVVAWQDGIQALVGKVIQTGNFESLVMPVFDINSQVSSRFSVSRYEGIVEGQGNPEVPLLMRFVPKRARDDINIGDIIITSGMGGIFPAGINIGRVSAVNVLEYENTLEVEVIPMIDYSRLEYVFVIEAEPSVQETGTGFFYD